MKCLGGVLVLSRRCLGGCDAGGEGGWGWSLIAAIAKVASLLEEGDLQALEDTIGEILEAGRLISTLEVTYSAFQDSHISSLLIDVLSTQDQVHWFSSVLYGFFLI